MRISADVVSLVSAERLVIVEHTFDDQTRCVKFPLSLYKKTHFSEVNEVFRSINEYWDHLPLKDQSEIYAIYEDIRELFDSITAGDELQSELSQLVKRLMDHHQTKDVEYWIRNVSSLKVHADVKYEYVYDVDKNTTEDKTYIYDDYIGLMALSVIFRAMIPIWAMFNKPAKNAIGKTLKEFHSFLLLQTSEVYQSKAMKRLTRYIKANIDKDTHTGNHTLEFICTDDMPFYFLSLVCVRKLCLGELYDQYAQQNLAALVYTFIIDRPGPQGGDHSLQVRSKKLNKEGGGETSDNSGSTLELYKARANITMGRIAEMEYSLRDPVALSLQLCPEADETLVRRDCLRALDTSLEMLDKGIQVPQVILSQWVINPVFPAQGLLYMEEDILVRVCAITETVLRHRNFGYLGLLATSVALIEEDSIRITPMGSKSQITDDLAQALAVNFPFQREPKRKTATNSNYDFVQEDIKRLSSEFARFTWRATADEALVTKVLGTHLRRVGILPQLKSDIGYMLVDSEQQFN